LSVLNRNKKETEVIISFPVFVLLFIFGHFVSLYFNLHNLIIVLVIFILFIVKLKYGLVTLLIALFLGMFNANLFLYPKLNNLQLEKYDLLNEYIVIEGIIRNKIDRKWSEGGDVLVSNVYIKQKKLNIEGIIKFKNSSDINLNEGDKVLLRGKLLIPDGIKNYGAFNYKLYLKRKQIFYTMKIKYSRNIKILSKNNQNLLENIRVKFKNRIINFSENREVSGFYLSILMGDKSYLDRELKEKMLSLGIIHLLAISGFHIVILFSVVYFLVLFLLRIFLKVIIKTDIFKLSLIFSIIFINFYLILIGFPLSATRAVIMISLFSLSKIFEKNFNPLNILALSALIILLVDNSAFLSIGFYLSFLAVLSFFIPIKIIKVYFKEMNKYYRFLLNYLLVNISVFLVTMPILLFVFYKISIGQIIFNFIFIPIFSFIIYPVSLFSIIFKIEFFIDSNYSFFKFLTNLLSGNYFFINPINTIQLILSIGVILLIFYLLFIKKWKIISLLLVFYFIIILFPVNREKSGLNIYFMSVGNGDSILITKNNKSILIDSGSKLRGNNGKKVIIPHLDYFNIKKIDYAIITHLDEDHFGGFYDLIKEDRIKTVISSVKLPENMYNSDIDYKIIKNTEIIKISDIDITLFPSNNFEEDNNNSIITYFEYKNYKFLFTGDSENKREKLFMEKHKNIKNITLLKLGHHGARQSSSFNFLKTLQPKIAIISCGKNNRFHHPHAETLRKLNELNIDYYRTDLNGEISVNLKNKIEINILQK